MLYQRTADSDTPHHQAAAGLSAHLRRLWAVTGFGLGRGWSCSTDSDDPYGILSWETCDFPRVTRNFSRALGQTPSPSRHPGLRISALTVHTDHLGPCSNADSERGGLRWGWSFSIFACAAWFEGDTLRGKNPTDEAKGIHIGNSVLCPHSPVHWNLLEARCQN